MCVCRCCSWGLWWFLLFFCLDGVFIFWLECVFFVDRFCCVLVWGWVLLFLVLLCLFCVGVFGLWELWEFDVVDCVWCLVDDGVGLGVFVLVLVYV